MLIVLIPLARDSRGDKLGSGSETAAVSWGDEEAMAEEPGVHIKRPENGLHI
jgi:hypothetical protein